ncbi:MAG: leucine-rich repeat domain-containing protein, partial [Candidatus Coproplasma sp.]
IYAKDGSAMGYGYVSSKQTAGYYLKDRNIETTETLTLEKTAGYDLYTKPGTTSCAYAIKDDDPIYTGITPSADMTSAVYYYNSEKTHVESYEIVTPAGADTDGLGRYTCQDCGATRDVVIEAVGHVHNYVTTVTPPTCTERGYTTHTCDVEGCTDSYVTDYVDALGHDYSGEGTVVTPPKCLEQGYTTYTCQREGCGYSYVGDYVTILGHDYVENVIVEPTASSAGLNRYTCSRCDDFSQDRVAYLAPTEVDVKVTVDVDGVRTELTVKLSDIYNYSYTAPSALTDYALALTGIKTFTVDGTSYTKANVVEISVPLGVLTVNNSGSLFNNNKVIEKVDFSASDGVTVNSNAFQNATSLKDIVFGDNMTISEKAFNTCTALTKIVVGDGLTINFNGQYIFNACSNIESVEFGASDITFGANSFRTTSSTSEYTPITSIKFSDGGNYTFGAKAFGRTSITELIIPDGATAAFSSTSVNNTDPFWSSDFLIYAYVGEGTLNVGKMFDDCMGLEEVVLVGPETIGTYGFCDYTGRSDKTLKVYIHKSDVTFGDNAFYKRSGIQVYTMAPITKANVFNSCSSYTIYYGTAHEYTPHTFAPTCTEYGYDGYITSCPHCGENIEPEYSTIYQVFENALTSGTASSETILDKTNFVNPAGHSAGEVIRIVYENGFDNVGSYKRVCTVCGENYDAEYADAIFKALGYSPKNDNTSIYAGFIVNIDALNAYNSYLEVGKELKYGILVSNVTGKDALTVADGSVDTNSVMAEIKDHTLNRIGISINGLADHVDLEIVISAYVIDENGDISFIQKNGAKNGSYYTSGVTVNGAENALGAMTLNQIITLGQVGYEDACATSGHTVVVDPAVAPTCTTTGLTEGKHCSACYAVIVAQKTVAATGHTPGPEATCTTAQTCTVCGAVLTDATGHTEVIDPEAEPTCTATGLTEGKHCSVCNIIIVAQNTVPALGHTEVTIPGTAATCVATGLSDGKKCTVCNAITEAQTSLPALGHTYGEWVVTKEATQTETGTKEHTCSVCSYTESVIIN